MQIAPRHIVVMMCISIALGTSTAHAQDKPILRIIVPTAAGHGLDMLARIIAPKLAENLGRNIIVDNKAGAGGLIGAQVAAKSAPDGNTLFFGFAGTHGIFSSLYRKLPYDPVLDFEPVVALTYSSNVLIASKESSFKSVSELVEAARKKPDALTMGSSGSGNTPHLSGAILNKMAGIKTLHVPFKTNPITEVMAGRVDYAFESTLVAAEFIKADKVTALAVTAPTRDAKLPSVPTLAESGYPGYSVIAWSALFAPAKSSPIFIKQVNEAANKALKDPALIARLAEISSTTIGGSPDDLRARVKTEIAKWPEIIKEAGAQVD